MQETRIWSLDQEDPLEKEMATHSSILAWRIPWTEKSGGLHSMGSQWVGHDWASKTTTTYLAVPGLSQGMKIFHLCFQHVSDQGSDPGSLCWQYVVLAAGPPGKFPASTFDSCESCCSERGVQISGQVPAFSSFGCLSRNRIAGSHGNSLCNLWRKFLWNFPLYCKSPR